MRKILILFLFCVGGVNAQQISVRNGELRYRTSNGIRYAVDSDTLTTKLFGKVDKIAGKGLSANDYTNTEKTKLAAIGGSTFSATKVLINTNVDAGYSLDVNGSARIVGQLISDAGVPSNTRLGNDALKLVTGTNNTAVGVSALQENTSGTGNVAVGNDALEKNKTGNNNIAIGLRALASGVLSSNSVAIGANALQFTVGGSNTAVGFSALKGNTDGSGNIAFGNTAGRFVADGTTENTNSTNSVFIGNGAQTLGDNQANQIVIGSTAIGLGSNTAKIGNTSITKVATNGDFETLDAGDGLILKTPDGTKRYKITINNSGQIIATQL
jgi:hypothetical protein